MPNLPTPRAEPDSEILNRGQNGVRHAFTVAIHALGHRLAARPARLATVLTLVVMSAALLYRSRSPDPRVLEEMAMVVDVMDEAQTESLRELELLSEFDSLPVDDEEWELLLREGGSP